MEKKLEENFDSPQKKKTEEENLKDNSPSTSNKKYGNKIQELNEISEKKESGQNKEINPSKEIQSIPFEKKRNQITHTTDSEEEESLEEFRIHCQSVPHKKVGHEETGFKDILPVLGPVQIQNALQALGSPSTSSEISSWILRNYPELSVIYSSHKKLWYSVTGILSSKSYTNLFEKFEQDRQIRWALTSKKEATEESIISKEICLLCDLELEPHKPFIECQKCLRKCHSKCRQNSTPSIPMNEPWTCLNCQAGRKKKKEIKKIPITACEKHRKWKKKCPIDCPNRRREYIEKELSPSSSTHPKTSKNYYPVDSNLWFKNGIDFLNLQNPVQLKHKLSNPGPALHMAWSNKGKKLSVACNLLVKIWDANVWKLIIELKDKKEPNFEDLKIAFFSPSDDKIITGGKIKDKKQWNDKENDHQTIEAPIKIFDISTGNVILRLEGHTEEILCLRILNFKKNNYILSSSKDKKLIRWHLKQNFSILVSKTTFENDASIYDISFLSQEWNPFFLTAGTAGIQIFDFEKMQVIYTLEIFPGSCQSICFITPKELKRKPGSLFLAFENEDKNIYSCEIQLQKGVFSSEILSTYRHPEFQAGETKLVTNGRYLLASTKDGKVIAWNLRTTDVVGIFRDHEDQIRSILFHPTKRFLLTSSDDSIVCVYEQPFEKKKKSPLKKKQKTEDPNPPLNEETVSEGTPSSEYDDFSSFHESSMEIDDDEEELDEKSFQSYKRIMNNPQK